MTKTGSKKVTEEYKRIFKRIDSANSKLAKTNERIDRLFHFLDDVEECRDSDSLVNLSGGKRTLGQAAKAYAKI